MGALTPRFKFSYFGGSTPGTITDDGQKFTSLDPLTLDRLLAAVEAHDHRYHPPAGGVGLPLDGELLLNSGTLQGGYTYYYRFSVVDAQGNETVASPEVAIATPGLLPLPGMPQASASTEAGTLAAGMYYYGLTAIRGSEETPLGAASLIALQSGETAVDLQLPDFGDAEAFRVWRLGYNEPGYTKLSLIPAGAATWTDDGSIPADPCACDPGNAPPQSNTGTGAYAVKVTLPPSDELTAALATARSWRLYRTVYPGIYPTTALVHEVVERESEFDLTSPLQVEWIDRGGRLLSGKPMDSDLNMRFQTFAFERVSDLPDPAGYPEGYPLIFGTVLYALLDGQWTAIGGGGGGDAGPLRPPIVTNSLGDRYFIEVDELGTVVATPTMLPGAPARPNVEVN